ncbi:hypothetical protein [Streptomyces sp. NPDC051162]|uniref:hypothetical protein n=1 Tax=unclassified Streptomyces TaxID=2593676 RepID=UPI00341C1242
MNTSRVLWFVLAFAFAVPVMLVMFREDGHVTSGSWSKSIIFGVSIAVIAAIAAGKAKQ